MEDSDIVLVTNHAPICKVLRTAATMQYSLQLDKFRILLELFVDKLKVIYRPGKEMTNVDLLSRTEWL